MKAKIIELVIAVAAIVVVVWITAECMRPSPGDGRDRIGLSVTGNPTGTNPLCTTGSSLAAGLVCKDAGGAHVRACHFRNNSDAGAWFELADLTTIPTSYGTGLDAGAGMVGDPFFVGAGQDVVLETGFFGVDGWLTATGLAVGVSTTAPGDAGTFTTAGSLFQITCNGQ